MGGGASSFASGKIEENWANAKVTFFSNDFSEFTWTGGTFDADVYVSSSVTVHIAGNGDKTTLRKFENHGDVWWDGGGRIVVGNNEPANDASFWNHYHFTAEGGQNPVMTMSASNSVFVNMGQFTAAPTNELKFDGDGWIQNFGTFTVNGKVTARNYQNSGDVNIASSTSRMQLGTGGTHIWFFPIENSQPTIQGNGKAIFAANSLVTLDSGTSLVQNVHDQARKTQGAGNLLISGVYELGTFAMGTTGGVTEWTGAGTTRALGTPSPPGRLSIYAADFTLSRAIVNESQWSRWESTTPAELRFQQGGSITNLPGAEFGISANMFPAAGTMSMTGGPAGYLLNLGLIETSGSTRDLIQIDIPYVPFASGFQWGRLKRVGPKLIIGMKQVGSMGVIENTPGDGIKFAQGIEMTDGEITNAGRIEVVGDFDQSNGDIACNGARIEVSGTYALSGGTADFSGTLGGLSLLADQINQTGGTLKAYDAMINVAGVYNQTAGTVELKNSSATVYGGWFVGQAASLYAYLNNTITGNLSNGGHLELGPMTAPPSQPWKDTLSINGDFGQSATGSLTLDVSNSNTDALHVSDHAGLGGGLTVRAPAGWSGFPGQQINLIFYQTRSGTFGGISLPSGNWIGEYVDNPPDGPGWFRIRRPYMFP